MKKWGYSYAEALSIVAERIKNPILKSLLGRYANAIDSSVPDDEYLKNELSTVRSVTEPGRAGPRDGDKMGRCLCCHAPVGNGHCRHPHDLDCHLFPDRDGNNPWHVLCDHPSDLFFRERPHVYVVPDDPKSHGLTTRASKEQQTIHAMERIIVPLAIVAVVVLVLLGVSAGFIFLLIGILMAPLGIIGFIDDSNITVRDNDFSTFIRSLGAVMGGQGMTAVYALATIDKKSLVALEPLVNSVYSKMNLGLDDKQVWDKFTGESGSNLIYKYLNIYLDTVTLGGPPDAIGTVVGSSMLEQTLLREKKDMHARSFIILLVPMHIAMAGIFVVLYRIMVVLTGPSP